MSTSDVSPAGPQAIKELVVQNKMGIHARPAAMIVRITNKFKSEVFVEKDEEQVNGKSIMGLMMLAAGRGSKVKFMAWGVDAPMLLGVFAALFTPILDVRCGPRAHARCSPEGTKTGRKAERDE